MKKPLKHAKFVEGLLYTGIDDEPEYILRLDKLVAPENPRFTALTKTIFQPSPDGYIGFGRIEAEDFRRAYLWSDLLTPADRKKATSMIDPMNGRFEDEVLRHLAARRAKLRKLTPVLGGEYYCK